MARLKFLFVSSNFLQKFERIFNFHLGGDRFFDEKLNNKVLRIFVETLVIFLEYMGENIKNDHLNLFIQCS